MTQTKSTATKSEASKPNKSDKTNSKKWQWLLLTGIALALIPRRSSRRTDMIKEDSFAKDMANTDK